MFDQMMHQYSKLALISNCRLLDTSWRSEGQVFTTWMKMETVYLNTQSKIYLSVRVSGSSSFYSSKAATQTSSMGILSYKLSKSDPAVLTAFESAPDQRVLSLFISHGAQLDGFALNPVSYLNNFLFSSQVKFLRSIGFSDWNSDHHFNNFLWGAVTAGDIAELLFGLEEVKLDPNNPLNAPLFNNELNVFMASLLVEFDAQVNLTRIPRLSGTTPLNVCIRNENSEVVHWLLSRDATTILDGRELSSAWQTAWRSLPERLNANRDCYTVNFIQFEGVLGHLLWHNSDPHATFNTVKVGDRHYKRWYFISSTTRAQEVARAYSYHIREPARKGSALKPKSESLRLWEAAYERSEQLRVPDVLASWSSTGILCGKSYDSDDGSEYNSSAGTESWSGEEDCFAHEEQPFENATLFYETISTEEGRRQLARFPFLRLLVNSLQLAGYRAEMDDDGDVWYDDDDGDRYFDAREYQPEEGVDDGLVANCPICQDPEKYGLGHVFAEAERARQVLREYRRRKAEEKGRRR
ncbi:Hypothetical protein NCS54_00604300 [Fusarium falciforme]|uniref:Hypothetical protein n=1 Tax=Fusarium falciforme TaxID=195108 RepID=UPI0023012F5B|nr:Hypothetical protein NCS54_00604300 [Fusarium falciforme]WAO88685.1 Hypothetical protein NCS54_00604300 [Fusarium falciforme]